MKNKPRPHTNEETDRTKPLPMELSIAIDELPLLKMVHSVQIRPMTQPDPHDRVATVLCQAKNLLEELGVLAGLGNEEAIGALRDIGIGAAEKLASLMLEKDPKDYPEKPSLYLASALPVVKLRGDFSTINKILEERSDDCISKITDPTDPMSSNPQLDDGGFVVDVIHSLYWRNDLACKVLLAIRKKVRRNNSIKMAKMAAAHPSDMLSIISRGSEIFGLVKESEMKSVRAEIELHDSIRRRLEERLMSIGREAASGALRKVASKSTKWPVALSAIEEIRGTLKTVHEDLNLGGGLSFRLKRKSGAGSPRKFNEGSAASFALGYMLELNAARESMKGQTEQQWQVALEKLAIINEKTLPSIAKAEKDGSIELFKKAAAFDQRWRLSSAFLPEFPFSNKTTESDEKFRQWLETAMYRAEWECRGDWENYPWWPKCVTTRSRKGNRIRSARDTVLEKLQSGLRGLQF